MNGNKVPLNGNFCQQFFSKTFWLISIIILTLFVTAFVWYEYYVNSFCAGGCQSPFGVIEVDPISAIISIIGFWLLYNQYRKQSKEAEYARKEKEESNDWEYTKRQSEILLAIVYGRRSNYMESENSTTSVEWYRFHFLRGYINGLGTDFIRFEDWLENTPIPIPSKLQHQCVATQAGNANLPSSNQNITHSAPNTTPSSSNQNITYQCSNASQATYTSGFNITTDGAYYKKQYAQMKKNIKTKQVLEYYENSTFGYVNAHISKYLP